jgi:hypothetical protein
LKPIPKDPKPSSSDSATHPQQLESYQMDSHYNQKGASKYPIS